MSQDFYSSGYNMGGGEQDQWSQQGGWSQDQTWNTSQPYSTLSQPQPQYTQPQYSQQQYSQYGYSQPQETQQQGFYSSPTPQDQYSNYSSPPAQSYPASDGSQSFYSSGASFYDPNANMGSMGAVPQQTSDSFEDEPPLMEELGIDLQQIYQTTMTVLNPSKPAATTLMDDPDLSGPLMFCLGFGSLLLLSGKIHFGYIYGVALIGAASMYTLLNLMSVNGVSASITVSVLGYCMLPMCILAAVSALLSLKGLFGIIVSIITVSWAAFASSKLFVSVLAMYDQQPLVAYPCAIMYGIFAVLTVF